MSIFEVIALFGTMAILAAMPSASVALVITRSITLGLANGLAVGVGIVLGDLVFIALVLLGLSVVAETMGSMFMVVKYLGATFLVWLGFTLLRSKSRGPIPLDLSKKRGSLVTSFLAGFFLTLGDLKAILFYLSLLPMFIDLTEPRLSEVLIVISVTIFAVGGTKALYAVFAQRLASLAKNNQFENASRKAAGATLIGAGSYLVVNA